MDIGIVLRYYKRREIQEMMVEAGQNKEVVVRYGDKFGQRPDVLMYPQEVIELAQQRATSFHCSEELWGNPLQLKTEISRREMDGLRKGWDLVLDVDCAFLEYSKIAADLIVKFLKFNGVESISAKFSGNKGFHIGVPFEAFPSKIGGKETRLLFPEAARRMAFYIKEGIKEPLGKRILEWEKGNFAKVREKVGKKVEEIRYFKEDKLGTRVAMLEVEPFLEIDTLLISARHLYRMPYSLHEKTGLASVVIDPARILRFEKEMARPEKVKVGKFKFLDRGKVREGEGKDLMLRAFDFRMPEESVRGGGGGGWGVGERRVVFEKGLKGEFFPPCIKKILGGLSDGRKRSVFVLLSFLRKVGWSYEEIRKELVEWNKRNEEPLGGSLVLGQWEYHRRRGKEVLPPNCGNEGYYKDMGVCQPDSLCGKIKNPVSYAVRRIWWKGRKGK